MKLLWLRWAVTTSHVLPRHGPSGKRFMSRPNSNHPRDEHHTRGWRCLSCSCHDHVLRTERRMVAPSFLQKTAPNFPKQPGWFDSTSESEGLFCIGTVRNRYCTVHVWVVRRTSVRLSSARQAEELDEMDDWISTACSSIAPSCRSVHPIDACQK